MLRRFNEKSKENYEKLSLFFVQFWHFPKHLWKILQTAGRKVKLQRQISYHRFCFPAFDSIYTFSSPSTMRPQNANSSKFTRNFDLVKRAIKKYCFSILLQAVTAVFRFLDPD